MGVGASVVYRRPQMKNHVPGFERELELGNSSTAPGQSARSAPRPRRIEAMHLGRGVLALPAFLTLFGCSSTEPTETLGDAEQYSVETPQTPLDGATVQKYVDPVPTFSGRRSNGQTTQQIRMVEFQQRVLPAAIYAGLPAPFNAGTYTWGYSINSGTPSWPSVTIESRQNNATTAIYTNALQGPNGSRPVLARYLTVD